MGISKPVAQPVLFGKLYNTTTEPLPKVIDLISKKPAWDSFDSGVQQQLEHPERYGLECLPADLNLTPEKLKNTTWEKLYEERGQDFYITKSPEGDLLEFRVGNNASPGDASQTELYSQIDKNDLDEDLDLLRTLFHLDFNLSSCRCGILRFFPHRERR